MLGCFMLNGYVFDCSEDGLKSHLLISSACVLPYLCVLLLTKEHDSGGRTAAVVRL